MVGAVGLNTDMKTMYTAVSDQERCYRAVLGKDRRFDGVFYTGVRTTGIYCRPSCPAVTPRRKNVVFYPTAAAAQGAGFRACRRCRPDLTPGSPEWDVHADVAGRAMRMISDGVVEREGVPGLAARTGYTPRHLSRVLTSQLGAGPLALARAQRSHTARILIETTDLGLADVAFAAGFTSVRQFNQTIRDVYAATPSQLRATRRDGRALADGPGTITVSLAVRQPFDAASLLDFLIPRMLTGVEESDAGSYSRTLRLPHGLGRVRLTPQTDRVECRLNLADLRDLSAAVERCRRLLDLDADPVVVDGHLASDELLRPLVLRRPGVRVPGHVDGFEVAMRAVVGQQISVAGARTVTSRLVASYGERVEAPGTLTHAFPTADAIAAARPGCAAHAASPSTFAGRTGRGSRSGSRCLGPQRGSSRRSCSAAGAARHRSLDSRLHRLAGTRRPRRLSRHRSRRQAWSGPAGSRRVGRGHSGPGGPLEPVAVLCPDARLEHLE